MKISIIIPIYNVENHLDECIQSVTNQTYKNTEIILINDGSPDSCPSKCEEWKEKDDRIIVIHQENSGLSAARNAGIKASTGSYITFLDSDDYYCDLTIFEKAAHKIANQSVDMVMFHFIPNYFFSNTSIAANNFRNVYVQELTTQAFSHHAVAKLIRRDIIIDHSLYFQQGILCEDVEWFYRFSQHIHTIALLQDYAYYYRTNPNSITQNINEKYVYDLRCATEKHYQNILNSKLEEPFKAALLSSLCGHYLIMLKDLSCLPHNTQKKLLSNIKDLSPIIAYDSLHRKKQIMHRLLGVYRYVNFFSLKHKISKKWRT